MPGPVYLAVLKASYDYATQSDDEVALKEDQLLFLLDKSDPDWWKVKIKPDSPDDDAPSGLVPSAYVEEADPVSVVKCAYDYEASADNEMSVKEDEVLLNYATDEGWILAKSRDHGTIGYIPGNYVEEFGESGAPDPVSEEPPAAPPIPIVPTIPVQMSSPVEERPKADSIQTWSVSELDKKGKKKKGTLGVGNGSLFFASEADKTPVQKWRTSEVESVKSEKGKIVVVDLSGATPTTLKFHAGNKDTAEAIIEKLQGSISIAPEQKQSGTSSSSAAVALGNPARFLPPIQTTSAEPKKTGVHFATSPPAIIPRSDDDEEEEPEREQIGLAAAALYDFHAGGDDELSVKEGEKLWVIDSSNEDWWSCRNAQGAEGVVPASYVELSEPRAQQTSLNGTATNELTISGARYDSRKFSNDQDEQEPAIVQDQPVAQSESDDDIRRQQEEIRRLEEEKRELERKLATETEKRRQDEEARRKELAEKTRKEQLEKRAETRTDTQAPETKTKAQEPESSSRAERKKSRGPLPKQTRTWHDKTGQFQVDAEFLGLHDGKVRLHKSNGVVIEVPAAKMSAEDMEYIRRLQRKKSSSGSHTSSSAASKPADEDDVPLGSLPAAKRRGTSTTEGKAVAKKSAPIDWFEFFLNAGCEIDQCTRYASAFERDSIDESLLSEIKESTLRSLGLKEGDIIRVSKAIQQRTGSSPASAPENESKQKQIAHDEELARKLQAQEDGTIAPARQSTASPGAPNLFASPDGTLKSTRRGRPQPSKSAPPLNVDLDSISTASDSISRKVSSPSNASPALVETGITPPKRTSSITPSGFDDDAWTNRPSSTRPGNAASPVVVRTPPAQEASSQLPASSSPAPATATTGSATQDPGADANFALLAKIAAMRPSSAPSQPLQPSNTQLPPGFQQGMGIGASPIPIAQLSQTQLGALPNYSTTRGPLAPVASNQPLLNPLIPTNTGFGGFVPARASSASAPPVPPLPNFNFAPSSTNTFSPPPLAFQPTGFPIQNFAPLQPQPTSFAPQTSGLMLPPGQAFGSTLTPSFAPAAFASAASPPPPNHSPANIFAQMKSGTFGQENAPQNSEKYDALRPGPVLPQATGWGVTPNFGQPNGFTGFPR